MQLKPIIISLLLEDLRFNQYIYALRKLGIEVYHFDLDLMGIVAKLMELTEEEFNDSWMELYVSEVSKCENLPVEPMGKNLQELAEESYKALSAR